MSAISPIGSGGAAIDTALPSGNGLSEMENNFITLMVAQIQNQDPTNPIDSNEFLQQNAALSQVKSMENMAALARSGLVMMDNVQTLAAAALAGETVTVRTGALRLDEVPLAAQVELAHPASRTVLTLTDELGRRHQVELGPRPAGLARFEVDPRALGLPPGRYSATVSTDAGESPPLELRAEVRAVRIGPEGPMLDVAGAGQISLYNVIEFTRG